MQRLTKTVPAAATMGILNGTVLFHMFLLVDGVVKTSNLLAIVIAALDNNTQGQAAAGIQ
jgi:hypothetical protein